MTHVIWLVNPVRGVKRRVLADSYDTAVDRVYAIAKKFGRTTRRRQLRFLGKRMRWRDVEGDAGASADDLLIVDVYLPDAIGYWYASVWRLPHRIRERAQPQQTE